MENEEQQVEDIFQYLLDAGALVLTGMSAYGEPAYQVTEKCREIFPEFYEMHKSEIGQLANRLWQRGLIDITFTDDAESISFGEANFEVLQDVYQDLTEEEVHFLSLLGAPIQVRLEVEEED